MVVAAIGLFMFDFFRPSAYDPIYISIFHLPVAILRGYSSRGNPSTFFRGKQHTHYPPADPNRPALYCAFDDRLDRWPATSAMILSRFMPTPSPGSQEKLAKPVGVVAGRVVAVGLEARVECLAGRKRRTEGVSGRQHGPDTYSVYRF